MGKKREPIPPATAARVLFLADRICCKCRDPGKPLQIHHIDENPANNEPPNLAVLCLDCHHETQLQGGFARGLTSDQVVLYRDDWLRTVSARRASASGDAWSRDDRDASVDLRLVTSLAEIYRENGEWELLAMHFAGLGNDELRDKYVDLALEGSPSDGQVVFLRGDLQGRPDLIPQEVAQRQIDRLTTHGDWSQRARLYRTLGRNSEATSDYIRSALESLEEGRSFSAAYYLKEMVEEGLVEELFVAALAESADEGDLWWQVRALEELGWRSELDDLLAKHADEIESSRNPHLLACLAQVRNDPEAVLNIRAAAARLETTFDDSVWKPTELESIDAESEGPAESDTAS